MARCLPSANIYWGKKENRKETEILLYCGQDAVLIYYAQIQRLLYSCNNAWCARGGGRVENRDLQMGTTKNKRDEQSPREKQLFQDVSITKGKLRVSLMLASFNSVRPAVTCSRSIFSSRAGTLSAFLPLLHVDQPWETRTHTLADPSLSVLSAWYAPCATS